MRRLLMLLGPMALWAIVVLGLPGPRAASAGEGNWSRAEGLPKTTLSLAADSAGQIYAGTDDGVYLSTDGASWGRAQGEFPGRLPDGLRVSALAVAADSARAVYAGADNGFLFKSTDGGQQWFLTTQGLPAADIADLEIDPSYPEVVYAVGAGVYKSADGGASWKAASNGLPPGASVLDLALNPQDPLILYAGVFTFPSLPVPGAGATPSPGGGVYKSSDGGASWQPAGSGLAPAAAVSALAVDRLHSDTVYAGTHGLGLYKSSDGGRAWTAASHGLPEPASITELVAHPQGRQALYAGTHQQGVFKSTDGADDWRPLRGLPPEIRMTAMALAVAESTTSLYAGTERDGLWAYADTGHFRLYLPAMGK